MDTSILQTSLWSATAIPPPATDALVGERSTETLVIGGGFTGCSTALHLAERGLHVSLLEACEVGFGGSGRNVGMVNAAHTIEPKTILARLGSDYGEKFISRLAMGPNLVRSLIDRYQIECHAGNRGIVKIADSKAEMTRLNQFAYQLQVRGASIDTLSASAVSELTGREKVCGGIIDNRNFTLQPLSYVRGLAQAAVSLGAHVYANSKVLELNRINGKWVVKTALGSMRADRVVICTGAYGSELTKNLNKSFVPVGCFLLATKPLTSDMRQHALPQQDISFIDSKRAMRFARYDQSGRLIIGTLGWLPSNELSSNWAKRLLRSFFPSLPEMSFDFKWAGNIDLTDDHLPWLSMPEENLYVVGGLNGRGIALGTYLGKEVASWVSGASELDLSLPVKPIHKIPCRALKQKLYSTAFKGSLFFQ